MRGEDDIRVKKKSLLYKTWVWPYRSWHLHLITYVRNPVFLLQCQREVLSRGSLIKTSPEFHSNHFIRAETDGWSLINRRVIADSVERVKDMGRHWQALQWDEVKCEWGCAQKGAMSSQCSPLPPVPRSYNIDVLTVFVFVCVWKSSSWSDCAIQPATGHGGWGINLSAACRGDANNCIDLLTRFHLRLGSVQLSFQFLHVQLLCQFYHLF